MDLVLDEFIPEFQSTIPVGGGTKPHSVKCIFIHYFNPPSPWGEGLPAERR